MSTSADIVIRIAAPADAATIAVYNLRMAWETESIRLNPTTVENGVKAVLDDLAKGQYYVAVVDGRVAGCLLITHEWSDWRNGDIWWVQSVYVDTEFRRAGVFKTLYSHVRQLAIDAGAVAIRLYVDRHNDRAKASYGKFGFKPTDYDIMIENLV